MDEARGVTPAPTERQEAGKKRASPEVNESSDKREFSNEEIDVF